MDASEIRAKRLNAKEVILPERCDNCKFPIADATVQPYGGDQALRTSTWTRNQSIRGESLDDNWNKTAASMTTGTLRDQKICLIHGQVSHKLLY